MVILTHAPIDVSLLLSKFSFPECGAILTFFGTVRNHHGEKSVIYIEYEAYPEMAEKKLNELRGRLVHQYALRDMALIHRLGRLAVGETSLAVVVASAHRGEAFSAAQEAIAWIKKEVPIWKKEYFADGTSAAWQGETPIKGYAEK